MYLKITFSIEDSMQRWTQLDFFPQNLGTFVNFQKRVGGASPKLRAWVAIDILCTFSQISKQFLCNS